MMRACAQVVAAKEMAEDESSRLRQLLDESAASDEGSMSQHILRGYERRLAAAHQHLVRQVRDWAALLSNQGSGF